MDELAELIAEALADFAKAAGLADPKFIAGNITIEILPKPHQQPKKQPSGKMVVYAFFRNGQALKVGKVGLNSGARYTSQHYNPNSSRSNLARSILLNPERAGATGVDASTVGPWIKVNTDRVNLLAPASFGLPMLSLLEAFLHVRWKPMFEGTNVDN